MQTPNRSRRRLGRKTTEEEILNREVSADADAAAPGVVETREDVNEVEALPASPSPAPTEVAEERSPSLDFQAPEGVATPVQAPDGVETHVQVGLQESSQAAPDSQEDAL